ncbi:MAG: ChbG/HpnK family deacetylase [Crocinitomicaceae bacterium]
MGNKVILTADDYGICNRIDNGIIKAVKVGRITAVSAVVTHETSAERIRRLLALQKEEAQKGNHFGIGLHVSITSGTPLYKVRGKRSSLADPKKSQHLFRDADFYEFNEVESHHLREEISAQMDALAQIIGEENIDHITNHEGLVYFDKRFFNEYSLVAAAREVPMRSPMTWYRKFKKVGDVPDFDDNPIGNPIMRLGLSNGAWRKLAQMSYGNVLKRMNICEELGISYPDVLCEYIYGQCKEIEQGEKVIDHALNKFHLSDNRNNLELADRLTMTNAKKSDYHLLNERYQRQINRKEFVMELMFHLADDGDNVKELEGLENHGKEGPHGVNTEYYSIRDNELKVLTEMDLPLYADSNQIDYVPFKSI